MGSKKDRLILAPGAAPGDSFRMVRDSSDSITIRHFKYTAEALTELELKSVTELDVSEGDGFVHWIDIRGYDSQVLAFVGDMFAIHPLVLEDIAEPSQRPKFEEYPEYVFCTMRCFYLGKDGKLQRGRTNIILRENLVISFSSNTEPLLDQLLPRMRSPGSRIRNSGASFLAYALIDVMVDHYYVVLEDVGERIELVETEISGGVDDRIVLKVQRIKRELIHIRRGIWPLREAAVGMLRDSSRHFSADNSVYVRDLYDHIVQVVEITESLREESGWALELYMSSVSNQMNHVMKVLSVIATVFMPLTFIAGVYGMNFKDMPELEWRWAYPVCLAGMLTIALTMALWFRHKKWL